MNTNDEGDDITNYWAYDAGTFIEQGSLVISRVEGALGCHDLRQPYFHKCVVLLTEHSAEVGTRGIVLNRPSNLVLSDLDIIYLDDEDDGGEDSLSLLDLNEVGATDTRRKNEWPMWFGGDISGLFDETPMIVCLHNISSPLARNVSDQVLSNIMVTSHKVSWKLVQWPATAFSFFS